MQSRNFPGFTVGVTGGIGSGKSTVCEILGGLGRLVVSADPLARTLMENDERMRSRLKRALGDQIFRANGSLDRAIVSTMIFGDRSLRRKVNGIVHPRVIETIRKALSETPPERCRPYVVIEAALIYESGLDKRLNAVIVVEADLERRLERVMMRDNLDRKEILKRVRAQMSSGEAARRADFVIRNNMDPQSLFDKVRFVDSVLAKLSMKS